MFNKPSHFVLLFIFVILLALSATCLYQVDDNDPLQDDDSALDDDTATDDDVGDDDFVPDDDTAGGEYEAPDGLEIVFYDIGQGDAALIRFPEGSTMLVDGGPNQAGDQVILPHFDELHLHLLNYMVVTHPDADHCGGLDDVVQEIYVGELWENGRSKDTMTYQEFDHAVDQNDIPRKTVHRGDEEEIDGCQIKVLHADQGWGDDNTRSIVMSIACEGVTLLMTGDATEDTEEDLISVYGNQLCAEIVKVPHHGSPNREETFPQYVTPDVAVISCGAGNPYGHPNPEVVEEWTNAGADVYRTDQQGTITVTARDGDITIVAENP